jgi:ABC-type branched-subunit amino acid transport system substrate-binding protein
VPRPAPFLLGQIHRCAFATCLVALLLALAGCGVSKVAAPVVASQGGAPGTALEPPQAITPGAGALTAPGAEGHSKVALLVPLSGPNAAIGRAILEAAQIALFDVADENFELMPRDTQGTAPGAASAAEGAIRDGARFILGPLLQNEVEAVKPIARNANINVVAFSTATQLAGDGVYLMSFLPRQQVVRVTAFAKEKGATRFAALAPETPYGHLVVDELRNAVGTLGAALGPTQFYSPTTTDLTPVVRRLAGAGEGAFDAVMLPEGGPKLKAVASLLPYYDIDPAKVHILGTGLWDEPGVGLEPALVGGWFAAPPPQARADFEQRYAELYRHKPVRLATLGYDAVALAAHLAQHEGGADFSAAALASPNGFIGVDGIFRFLPDGLVQRGLAVLEVRRDGTATVSPAPDSFEDLSF